MFRHARAILWAQWRSLLNFYSRGNRGVLIFTVIMSAIWYCLLAFGSVSTAILIADPRQMGLVARYASGALFMMFLYWQIVPILLASTGASLDFKRLVVYPVTHRELFGLEVLLRLTTGADMLIVLIGVMTGVMLNRALPWWCVLVFLPWIVMNLALATGLRDLLGRLLSRRGVREFAMLGFVLLAALPQLVMSAGIPPSIRQSLDRFTFEWWPWKLVARLALGERNWRTAAALLGWTVAAYAFGRWQFDRGLRFDADEARSKGKDSEKPADGWLDSLYRLPGAVLPDPLAAMVEKELRFLSRAPRFRLVFLMGFSFGLLIWLPLAMRPGANEGFLSSNYLTFVTTYALMLLGEVSFWNAFGFDRGAAQNYYVLPVPFSRVLIAKNIAAAIFVFLEVTMVALVCALLRMPATPSKIVESYAVAMVMTLMLLGVGNLGSVYYPRPVNPSHSWRSAAAGRFQAFLMLLYPAVSIPVVLAYLARYAFQSQAAFYGMLTFGAAFAGVFYWVSLDSASKAALERKEQVVTALSAGEGPVAA